MRYVNKLDVLTLVEIMLDTSLKPDGRLLLPELCSQVACFQGDCVKYASGFNLFFYVSRLWRNKTKHKVFRDSGLRVFSLNEFIYVHK